MLEAVTPAQPSYDPARNLEAMRLMRQTIENQLRSPREYNARGATTRTDRGGSVHLNSSARLLSGASAGFMPLREATG